MNQAWAICLARADAPAVAALRLSPGIELGDDAGNIWLRGKTLDETLARSLSALPATGRFEWLPGDALRANGSRIPVGRFPNISWRPLATWSQVQAAAALPGEQPPRVRLRLVRSSHEAAPSVLKTTFDAWMDFTLSAGAIRLAPLRFAVSASGAVIVAGRPLPPLPGRQFVEREGIAVPAGFSWQPAVEAEVVRRAFQASGDALVIWDEDDSFIRLHAEQLLPASRSGVRASATALEEHA